MPPPPQMQGMPGGEPTVFQKIKMGAMTGTLVGLTIGFIGGGIQILRAGPGPRGALGTLSQFMLSSAATFGFFMSIGTVLRTEGIESNPYLSPAQRLVALQQQQKLLNAAKEGNFEVELKRQF
ncbi:related to MGR2 |uniref:Related to MGR2 \|nr:related to MGR2 \